MKKALCIGINDYPESPLKGCINDATQIATILKTNGDGSPNFEINLKTDIKTKGDLKKNITELFSGNPEIALFYFSGHGYTDNLGGYIVAPDAKQYDEGLPMDELLKIVINSKATNKIVILDCCFAGRFASPVISEASQLSEGVTILASSRKDEPSAEIEGQGVFTNLLISALEGGAANITGNITPGGIYAYVDQALGAWEQRPVFKTYTTTFVTLRTITPQVPIEIIRKLPEYFSSPSSQFQLDKSYEETEAEAKPENVSTLKNLQSLESVGLVVPFGASKPHIYWAAMENKFCKLTAIGHHYWRLAKSGKI